jgi:hypothetical protein
MSASQHPTPAVWIAITTSRRPTYGTGSVRVFNTLGPPNRVIAAARMVFGTLGIVTSPSPLLESGRMQ